MTDLDRWAAEETLLRVAWHYYKDELTQDEIARRLAVSRASVGRMLDRARKVGLVSISINSDHLAAFELSTRLCAAFGLDEAMVVPGLDEPGTGTVQRAVNARLGIGGAQYLTGRLRPGGSIGVGWGDTVSRVIAAADLAAIGATHMVTLTGGVDGYLHALANLRGQDAGPDALTASVIPSPIVASSPELAAALRDEPTIRQVLQLARSLQQAVVGVGTPAPDSTLVRSGYLSAAEGRILTERGVVGDILGQFFDIRGEPVDLPLHARRIGIDLAELRSIGSVIGVAGGPTKVDAIRGALAGGYLDVLVTDEPTALALLDRSA